MQSIRGEVSNSEGVGLLPSPIGQDDSVEEFTHNVIRSRIEIVAGGEASPDSAGCIKEGGGGGSCREGGREGGVCGTFQVFLSATILFRLQAFLFLNC